jgi:hypothetical protein
LDWTLYKMIRDNENNIIPQMLIPGTGFRPLTGEAVDVGRYGYDNIMWGKTSGGVYVPVQVDAEGKQAVKASELETKIDTLNAKVDGIISGDAPAKTQLTGSKVGNAFEIIPDDAIDLTHETIAIYVGFDGDLKVDLISGETITMYNLAAGAWHPIRATRVYATGTTATYILGAY